MPDWSGHHRQQDGHDLVRSGRCVTPLARQEGGSRFQEVKRVLTSWWTRCATFPKISAAWQPIPKPGSSSSTRGRATARLDTSRHLRDAHPANRSSEHKFHATELTVWRPCAEELPPHHRRGRRWLHGGGERAVHPAGGVSSDDAADRGGRGHEATTGHTFGMSDRYQHAVRAIAEGFTFLQDVGVVS